MFHLVDESLTECTHCGSADTMKKLLTAFRTTTKKALRPTKAGELTEQFIEDARADLAQQKTDLDKKR